MASVNYNITIVKYDGMGVQNLHVTKQILENVS